MSSTDRRLLGRPVGAYKQDFNLYYGAGSGGGTSLTVANTQRYTWFVDLSEFDVLLREVLAQNTQFSVYLDSGGLTQKPLYFNIYGSNDYPTENIIAEASAKGLQFAGATPYNIDIFDINLVPDTGEQLVSVNAANALIGFYTDQGDWIYLKGYKQPHVNGLGASGSIIGNNNKLVQPFVPSTSRLIRFDIGIMFLSSLLNQDDHTSYSDVIVELWDAGKNVIFTETISRFANPIPKPGNTTILPVPYIDSMSTHVADDGLTYWTQLWGVKFAPNPVLNLTIGATYYIVVKLAQADTVNRIGVATNTAVTTGVVDLTKGKYIYGDLNFAAYAGTTLTPLPDPAGNAKQMVFCTMTDKPRIALTAAWDSSAYYWFDPAASTNQIKFLKVDTDRRI